MKSPLFWPRAIFAVLLAVVTFLTVTPNPVETETGYAITRWISSMLLGEAENADKVGHFLAYATLGAAAFWARLALFSKRWAAALALVFYGAALEGVQGLGGVRTPELADALANALGAFSGFLAASLALRLKVAQQR